MSDYISRRLQTPIFPVPPRNVDQTPRWADTMTFAINEAFRNVSTRIEELSTSGGTGRLPDQGKGIGRVWYDEDTSRLYFDGSAGWEEVLGDVLPGYVERSEWKQNGFVDATEVWMTWSDLTRTLTLDVYPEGSGEFSYYQDGVLYTKTSAQTKQITDTEGLWAFYFDGATLNAVNSPDHEAIDNVIKNKVVVAYVYWDAANNLGLLFHELHGCRMSPDTHHYLHDVMGAQYSSGLALGDILADQSGASNSHAQFSVGAGDFYDEDLKQELEAAVSTAGLPILYFNGAALRWTTNKGYSILTAGSGRMAYNSSGAQAEVDNGKYALCHVFATSAKTVEGFDRTCFAVQGQAQYSTLAAARAGANSEINSLVLGALPIQELVPVGTVIFQTNSGYANAVKSRIVSTDTGASYVDWRSSGISGGSSSTNDHGMLSGLSDDDHPQYLPLTAGDTRKLTGHLHLATDQGIKVERYGVPGVFVNALYLDGTGNQTYGNKNHHTKVDSTDVVEMVQPVLANLGVVMPNTYSLGGKESGGTERQLARVNSSNEVELGDANVNLNLLGAQIDALPALANNVALRGEESGGTARDLLLLNSSNILNIGNASVAAVLNGSSLKLGVDLTTNGNKILMDSDTLRAKAGWRIQHEASPGSGVWGTLIGTADLGSSGNLVIGQASGGYYRTILYSPDYVSLPQHLTLDNAQAVKGFNAAGSTQYNLALVNSSNETEIGSASLPLNLKGTRIDEIAELANAVALKGEEIGGTARDLIKVDSSDDVIVGGTVLDTKLRGLTITSVDIHKFGDISGGSYSEMQTDGDLIQYGAAKIQTAASAQANNVWSSDFQATKSKTLSNNVSANFFKWGSGAAAGASMHYTVDFVLQVQYTYSGTTYYWTRGGRVSGTIQHLSASLSKGILLAVVWDGTGIAFSAAGGSNTPSMGETVTMNTSVAAADLGPTFLVNLTGAGYSFVSGYVHYTVISTDVNHTAWTGAFV